MSYFANYEHFRNYVRKVRGASDDEVLMEIWESGGAEDYRNKLICQHDVDQKVKYGTVLWTEEFYEWVENNAGIPGIYTFWDDETCLYVGKSKNLGDRVPSSLSERCKDCRKQYTLRAIEVETAAHADILEMQVVHYLQPTMNGERGNYGKPIGVKPDLSDPIPINTPVSWFEAVKGLLGKIEYGREFSVEDVRTVLLAVIEDGGRK